MIHILFRESYFKPGVGASEQQDKPLPDPNGLLSSIIPAAAIRDANNAHTRSNQQILGGECKQSRNSYVKLTPVQQAHITKYSML